MGPPADWHQHLVGRGSRTSIACPQGIKALSVDAMHCTAEPAEPAPSACSAADLPPAQTPIALLNLSNLMIYHTLAHGSASVMT